MARLSTFLLTFFLFIFSCSSSVVIGQSDHIDSLIQSLSHANNNVSKGVIQIELAKQYLKIDLTKTKEYAIIALGNVMSSDSLSAMAFDQLGRYYFFSSKLDSAVYYFRRVDKIYSDLGDRDKQASNNLSLGSALLRQGLFQRATEAFITSATYFESIDNEGNAARCYANIATAFAELNDYDTAIEYNRQALDICNKLELIQLKMIILPNLATQHYKNGSIDIALSYYQEAESICTQHGNKRSLALIYNNLGDLYMSQENYEAAERNILKAVEMKKELNFVKGLEESYFNLGLIKYKNKNYRRALNYYHQIESDVLGVDRVKVLKGLKDAYKEVGNSAKALEYAEKAQILTDSIEESKSIQAITEISEKYQLSQKENEILHLTNDNQALEVAQLRNKNWIIILLSSLIALTIGLYAYIKNTKKNKKIIDQQHLLEQQYLVDQMYRNEQEAVVKMIKAQEQERNRISNDLHDSLGSKIATLQRNLQMIKMQSEDQQEVVKVSHDIAQELYSEIRDISHNINSGVLLDQGLIPALDQMAERVSLHDNLQMRIISVDVPVRLSNIIEIQLYRILQELVANVIKHAQANELIIQLTSHDDQLNVMVDDDGKGFDPNHKSNGMGLSGVKKRLSSLGSELSIDSRKNRGTTMIFNIPLS